MDYNTSRERLVMPEYGRNIQQMVDYALTIEDRDERTRCVATIANVMLNLFPQLREDANYTRKIWDHIAMISGYKLDVDSPYPLPEKQEATVATEAHIPYPMSRIRFRAYGVIVQNMLRSAVNADSEEERVQTVALTALYMKRLLLQNGKDSNVEERVANDIVELSEGQLRYDFAELMDALPDDGIQSQQRQWGRQSGGYSNSRGAGRQPQRFHSGNGSRGGSKQGGFRNNSRGGKRRY